MKKCGKCGQEKPLDQFHLQPSGKHGRHSYCKPCENRRRRESAPRTYSEENKRKWQIKSRYGLTPDDVEVMKASQDDNCAICQSALVRFHIDHCHNTGAVRGLVCHKCNIRLGGWDDLEWRDKAIKYLGLKL